MAKKLTPKQSRFIEEYLVDLNATQAAIRAGYQIKSCEEAVGFYVYALIDPRDNQIFYIGKGSNRRFAVHEGEWRSGRSYNPKKLSHIGEIKSSYLSVSVVCLADDLSEATAYKTERAFIDSIGLERLTNIAPGQMSGTEKLRAWAEDAVWRLKPYDQWLAEAPRNERDRNLYHLIVNEIKAILADERTGKRTCEQSIVEN